MLQKYVLFCASSFLQSKVCLDVCELSPREGARVTLSHNGGFFCLFSLISDQSADERQVETHTCKYLPQHMWTDRAEAALHMAHGEHVSGDRESWTPGSKVPG